MTYIAFYDCTGCRNSYTRKFTRWPFLRNFWTSCNKCRERNWPGVVREATSFKVVQVR